MKNRSQYIGALAIITCLAAQSASAQLTFDLASDFSATSNPNGAWSLGWTHPGSLDFQFYTSTNAPLGLNEWRAPVPQNPNGTTVPDVIFNPTFSPIQLADTVWNPRRLTFHPGPHNEHSDIRWISPATGFVQLEASFEGRDLGVGATSDVEVHHNGQPLFASLVTGGGAASRVQFSTNLFVLQGDTVDFRVGYGSNEDYTSDTTQVDVTITATELAPCDGPVSGGKWKNHGQYVSAFARAAASLVAAGLINEEQAAILVRAAAMSDCGKKK